MPPKLSPEGEVIAAHMAATTAAFQALVRCLQENGSLSRGEYQYNLMPYMEASKDKQNEMTLVLLNDIRQALLD